MLTTEQLNAIKERAEKASLGAWTVTHNTDIVREDPIGSGFTDAIAFADRSIDAEFIAHAREDIPALIAEVERLRKVNEKYFGILSELEYRINKYSHYGLEQYIEGWDSDD
ncbi:Uncharacterised protein [Niallia circulans]|uniref:hypothetical protein n=1 Tax=Niallia circulans TaxID=1397 RepID=UPI00077C3F96|nr:hypothetical protein [Niallia circulans]MDR4318733.1 hypothetical protein [Niallia circulans]MED3839304.1 hypothetical protein [Niallia circulans]MED4245286.1 hypothetical protein [Niallia circulans]MED4250822.1 hypothetical protein [Niallia circulans]QKH60106.1 hypothetical protein FOC77_05280 [Niallia circulans]